MMKTVAFATAFQIHERGISEDVPLFLVALRKLIMMLFVDKGDLMMRKAWTKC